MNPGRANLLRLAAFCCLALLSFISIAAHCGVPGTAGDDWQTFNHRWFIVDRVVAADVIQLKPTDYSPAVFVHLLGISAPDDASTNQSAIAFLNGRLLHQKICLLLENPQTRDADGDLRGYVFTSPEENISVELAKQGLAKAQRKNPCLLQQPIELAEKDARKHQRGIWRD